MIALAPAEVLDRSQPAVRGWFAERFGVPTDARVDGWPSIFERHDVLLAAPTVPGGTGALAARTTAGGSVCVGGAPMAATWSRNFRAAGSSGIQSPSAAVPSHLGRWAGSTTYSLSASMWAHRPCRPFAPPASAAGAMRSTQGKTRPACVAPLQSHRYRNLDASD